MGTFYREKKNWSTLLHFITLSAKHFLFTYLILLKALKGITNGVKRFAISGDHHLVIKF